MTKMTKLDRPNLKIIRSYLEHAFKAIEAETGVQMTLSTMKTDFESMFRAKIDAVLPATAAVSSPYANVANGVIPNGTKFIRNGTHYTVCGYKPSGRVYQYVGMGPGGGKWKFSEDQIRAGMLR